ncbi:phosphoesterase PA-phosphatase [Actinoplanes sp. NPDC026623]|uniref:phosphoesterase PA-phosphatase n=1 Tax=Actinoplanes sp. NPDC026623 TaxID=3155610 RepID=UPI0033EBF58D
MTVETPPAERTPLRRAAKAITDVLSPAALVSLLLLLIPVHAAGIWPGLGWGLLAIAFVSAAPLTYVIVRVRRRTLTDVHIGVREHRRIPFVVGLITVLAGLVVLIVFDAPRDLIAFVATVLVLTAATIAVTGFWKISVHAMVAMMTTGILVVLYGPVLWLLLPVVAVIGWARVRLADHTLAQVLAGAALGLALVGVFVALR